MQIKAAPPHRAAVKTESMQAKCLEEFLALSKYSIVLIINTFFFFLRIPWGS